VPKARQLFIVRTLAVLDLRSPQQIEAEVFCADAQLTCGARAHNCTGQGIRSRSPY